ncbi:MAG TPA: hypothetical protein VK585_07890 [Jiangellaceae bacterium]|nr:hypothetical protein [Jiangellaceae bacterium]
MSALSDFRDRLRRGNVQRAARRAGRAGAEGVSELAVRIKPLAASAREVASPKVEQAMEKITPVVESARERVTPAALSARDTFLEDVVPMVASAITAAADRIAAGATEVSERSVAVVEKPRRRRRRRRLLLILGGFTAAGAGAAAVLRRRGGEAQQWTTYDPSAAPWAPTPPEGDEDLPRSTADDAAGASPTEAVADAAEQPHEPTTPQAPATETALDGKRPTTAAAAKKAAAKKTTPAKRTAAKKTAPPKKNVPPAP